MSHLTPWTQSHHMLIHLTPFTTGPRVTAHFNIHKQTSEGLSFMGKFYQTFKRELMPIVLKLLQQIEEKKILPNLFYKVSITLIPKTDKDDTRKEDYRLISIMHTDGKILNKILAH